jgi:cytochrome b pre-mRNA-processing protein 3
MTTVFFINTRFSSDTPVARPREPLNMPGFGIRQAEQALGILARLFGTDDRAALVPLYTNIVAEARRQDWYVRAAVPDTMDGRFEMVALVLSLVLLRFEREGEAGKRPSVLLTEVFVDDMDGTMREIGFGDLVVGKRVGGIMSALGGRLGAYRTGDRRAALIRNLYRDVPPVDVALDDALDMVTALEARIAAAPFAELRAGSIG